jgi:hypothetical protein
MAWKTFDFLCTNSRCKEYHIKKEIMVKDSEKNNQICESCGEVLRVGFSASAIKTADNGNRLKL